MAKKSSVRVERFLQGEKGKQAAERLIAAGHILANANDLVGFLVTNPNEVMHWHYVVALSEDSRWVDPYGQVSVMKVSADDCAPCFFFRIDDFNSGFDSGCGVLVLCE